MGKLCEGGKTLGTMASGGFGEGLGVFVIPYCNHSALNVACPFCLDALFAMYMATSATRKSSPESVRPVGTTPCRCWPMDGVPPAISRSVAELPRRYGP